MEWLRSATGAVASALAGASKAVRERPGTAIAVTNALTAAFFVYIISEGKPVKYIKKKLFQAAMAAVPKSLVDKELGKIKCDIERDIIGHSLDGETLVQELPANGVLCMGLPLRRPRASPSMFTVLIRGKDRPIHFKLSPS